MPQTPCVGTGAHFDFDGARFSHAGMGAVLSGLREVHAEDDALVAAAAAVFDALYAAPQAGP